MGKKIISYCLWGHDRKYTVGAIRNAESIAEGSLFYGWVGRFYCDNTAPTEVMERLRDLGMEVYLVDRAGDWSFTVERFKAMDDADLCIFRDCDSRLSKRELDAVQAWIDSDKKLHAMKDHPYHGQFPILAGMWGIKRGAITSPIAEVLEKYSQVAEPQYFYDQLFLANYIWPLLKDSCMIHDEFFSNSPFPSMRETGRFVGQSYDEFDVPYLPHIKALEAAL